MFSLEEAELQSMTTGYHLLSIVWVSIDNVAVRSPFESPSSSWIGRSSSPSKSSAYDTMCRVWLPRFIGESTFSRCLGTKTSALSTPPWTAVRHRQRHDEHGFDHAQRGQVRKCLIGTAVLAFVEADVFEQLCHGDTVLVEEPLKT